VVLGFLRARGTPESEEVVNDVFVSAFSQLDRFEGDEPGFRAWIFQIARHKRVDALRKLGRTANTIALDDSAGSDPLGNTEEEAIAQLEDRELRAVLEQLPRTNATCCSYESSATSASNRLPAPSRNP